GDYKIRVRRSFPFFWLQVVEIFDNRDSLLASFSLPKSGSERARSLKQLVENNTVEALLTLDKVSELDALKEWAAGIRLLVDRGGKIYILDTEKVVTVPVELPARFTAIWVNLKLPFQVERDQQGHLDLDFESPWRLSSPIPPSEEGKDIDLVITS